MSRQSEPKLGVIGLGYAGLPSAVGFAERGFSVVGTDHDKARLRSLREGRSPLYEPGVQELLDRHLPSGRLRLADDIAAVVREATVIFICVGTPQAPSGEADLSQVEQAVKSVAGQLDRAYRLIVSKSTVPVTTAAWIKRTISAHASPSADFDVASNPEFLREGKAVSDFLYPDRIVLGTESERARAVLEQIYGSFECPVFATDLNTVEIIKHASNAFLAMSISYINMIADLCEVTGADVTEVAAGMGLDPRIGRAYLAAGPGYGGSCLPKDIRGFIHSGEHLGIDFSLLRAVEKINDGRIDKTLDRISSALGGVRDRRIGVLGLSFKAGTDDIRESPSIKVIERLRDAGAILALHDPRAMALARLVVQESTGRLAYSESPYEAAEGSDALLFLTAWPEYWELDFNRLRGLMATPRIFDGRNLLDPAEMRKLGFDYSSIGRP